jgi:hypothetical protein
LAVLTISRTPGNFKSDIFHGHGGQFVAELMLQKAFKDRAVAARCPDGVCAIYEWIGQSLRGHRVVKAWHLMVFF